MVKRATVSEKHTKRSSWWIAMFVSAGLSSVGMAAEVVIERDQTNQARIYQLSPRSRAVEVVTLVPLPPEVLARVPLGVFPNVEVTYSVSAFTIAQNGKPIWKLQRTDLPEHWGVADGVVSGRGNIAFVSIGVPGGKPLGTLTELRRSPLRAVSDERQFQAWLKFSKDGAVANLALSRFGLFVEELIQFELPAQNRDEYRKALSSELVDLGVMSITDDGGFVVVGSGKAKSFTTTRMVESKDNLANLGPNFSLPVMNVRRLSGHFGRVFELDFEAFGAISVKKASGDNCQVDGTGTVGNDCAITAATCAGPGVGNGDGWSAACSVKCYDGYKPCCNCYPWNKSASCTCSLDRVAIEGCLIPIKFGFDR